MKSKLKPVIAFLFGAMFTIVCLYMLNWYCGQQVEQGNHFAGFDFGNDEKTVDSLAVSPDKGLYPPPLKTIPEDLQNREPFLHATPDMKRIHKDNRYTLIIKDKTVLDVSIKMDKDGWRINPGEKKKKADKFLLFVGDSQVLGQAVNDDETLSASMSEDFPDYHVYNKGISYGYPGEILDRMRRLPPGNPAESIGAALFFFYDYHIHRNMGSLSTLSHPKAAWKPYYYENEAGEIVRGKTFFRENPGLMKLKLALTKNNIVRYFQYDMQPSDKDFRFEAKLLAQMKIALENKGAKKFIVVMMPDQQQSFARKLLPYLEAEGIFYIYLTHWNSTEFVAAKNVVDYDGHHSVSFYRTFGKELSKLVKPIIDQK